jgi:hypothetical protein
MPRALGANGYRPACPDDAPEDAPEDDGDEDEVTYAYDDDDEEERHMLVELSSSARRGGRSKNGGGGRGSARDLFDYDDYRYGTRGGEWSCRAFSSRILTGVLFLLTLGGVYYLGTKSGESHEDHNNNNNNATAMTKAEEGEGEGGGGTASNAASGGSFTMERLLATRVEGERIISMLDEYYSGKDMAHTMLMTSWAKTWDFASDPSDAIEKRRADKLIDTMARALVTDEQDTFLMGGIGSSVMAGHDNCHYDSYQTQMERLWSPVWHAAGMDFVFQNAGEGGGCGDSHKNQHYCMKQNISPNVDIMHYSWTYFEGGDAHVDHEELVRWAQMLPKRPIVHILTVGEDDPAANPDHPYNVLVDHYAPYGHNIVCLRTVLRRGGYNYSAEMNREIDPFDRFGWGYMGDGYHNTTRYGEGEESVRKNSLGIVMRNWVRGSVICDYDILRGRAFIFFFPPACNPPDPFLLNPISLFTPCSYTTFWMYSIPAPWAFRPRPTHSRMYTPTPSSRLSI